MAINDYYNAYQNQVNSNHSMDAARYQMQSPGWNDPRAMYEQMRQRQWWEDGTTLKMYGIEASTSLRYDSVSFMKRICDPFGKLHTVMINIDCMELRHMTPNDICKRLEHGATESPDWVHCGPTNKDLANPAIALAWSEWKMIYILAKETK